ATTSLNLAGWRPALGLPKRSPPHWRHWRKGTARPQSRSCVNSIVASLATPAPSRRRRSPFGCVLASERSPRPFPSIALSSTQERPHEIYRDRPVWCLRRTHLAHAGRRLAHHPGAAPNGQPCGRAATRLASGAVHVCHIRHHSLILDPDGCEVIRHVRYG